MFDRSSMTIFDEYALHCCELVHHRLCKCHEARSGFPSRRYQLDIQKSQGSQMCLGIDEIVLDGPFFPNSIFATHA
jgi:hypothetical protein